MSGPQQTLDKAHRLPSRGKPSSGHKAKPVVTHSKPKVTVLKCNEENTVDSVGVTNTVLWVPPEVWMEESTLDFVTTEKNYAWRKSRVMMTLKFLLQNTDELTKQPSQYLFDIRLFRYLSSGKHNQVETDWVESQNFLVREGLSELLQLFWTEHLQIETFQKWEKVHPHSVEALYHILMALWFISANPKHQHEMYLKLCKYIMLMASGEAFKQSTNKIKRIQDCLKAILGMVFQFVKHIAEAKDVIRECGGEEVIQAIANGRRAFNKNVKGRALMILAYVLDEEEQKKSKASYSIIEFLIDLLRNCLTTSDHQSPMYNYNALEILHGLNRLAVSDINKANINDLDGIKLYAELLEHGSLEEQEEACRGLWTLCFNQLVATDVSMDSHITEVLQKLANSEHEMLKAAACGCLWTVHQQKDPNPTVSTKTDAGHIMISYSWSVQAEAKELKTILHDNGYRVWMDIENMSGSTLSAMSQAIEKAAVVLILVSEKYKTSPACRAEAEYAYKLEREFIPLKVQPMYSPDGWLGMLLGMKLFFDLTNPADKSSNYEQLIKVLGEKGKGEPIQDIEAAEAPQDPKSGEHIVTVAAQPVLKALQCRSWSEEQVLHWLQQNKLEEVATRLGGGLNGEILGELKCMFHEDTDHYYSIVREDLQLQTVALLRLSSCLRALS